jgi:hypothetical protein
MSQDSVWIRERALAWARARGWRVGCNFTPSTASNPLELWQEATFDAATIERELGFADALGFTSVRVFLHDLAFAHDRTGFFARIERFLAAAAQRGIGVLFVLFDGVWDPQPRPGPQPEPRPGVHNSRWVQSPGAAILGDPARHDELRPYVQGVIDRFRDDARIDGWDLVNEPDKRLCLESSDVISFHHYGELGGLQRRVRALERYGRPILCTEFLARGLGSRFDPHLRFLRDAGVGAYCWGLVDGRTQTKYGWDSWLAPVQGEPEPWHHDVLRADGSPYDPAEVEFIRAVTRERPSRMLRE